MESAGEFTIVNISVYGFDQWALKQCFADAQIHPQFTRF